MIVPFLFLATLVQNSEQEARDFIQSLLTKDVGDEKKCLIPPSDAFSSGPDLVVFMSFGVPLATWKEHAQLLKKTGGRFVVRGLPNNSFVTLSQKLLELRNAGIDVPITLDPPLFELYGITAVPTIVLKHHDQFDKVSGNIKLSTALTLFSQKGETKNTAVELLRELEIR